jgi:NADH dehydrogenase
MNITIVGGGFGGVKAALELAKDKKNKVTLISDKPDFQYYPALYSSATGHSYLESWVPLDTVFKGIKNITVHIDAVTKIDTLTKVLTGASGSAYGYEKCILALGSVTTYFGIKGLDIYAYGIKSAEEIARLKRHIYENFAKKHTTDKHYVVVGAGPTGVELAAALGSYLRQLCERYQLKEDGLQVDLIEAAPRVLPKMHPRISQHVTARLERLGVHIQVGKAVESATANEIMVSGQPIKSQTVIWTSGVANHPFYKENESQFKFAPHGRVAVDQYMRAAPDVYVIGDNAATPYTGLAQTALHDAIFVARNLRREQRGQRPKEYKAVKPPVVVPVGAHWAAFEWKWLRLYGWIGAVLRRAADFIGYNDMLPIGQALGVWRASFVARADDDPPHETAGFSSKSS